VVFGCNCKIPGENVLTFANEGPIEMYIYYGQNISRKSIGYIRFNTPNKIRFTIDNSKIVSAHLDSGAFLVGKFYELKEERWA
jgi:UDP-N-acetylglucosamine transferase subunit ALG13